MQVTCENIKNAKRNPVITYERPKLIYSLLGKVNDDC